MRVKGLCSLDGCTSENHAKGYCKSHYQMWKNGNVPVVQRPEKICTVKECSRTCESRGYCSAHYQVWKRNGVPETEASKRHGTKDGIRPDGYRMIYVDGKAIREHRYVMEQHIGRKLTRKEHIHHKNEIKTDNRIENLLIVTNESHKEHHTKRWETEKPCSLCGIIKSLERFNFRLNKASYKERKRFYDSWCVQCVVDRKREWRKKKLTGN